MRAPPRHDDPRRPPRRAALVGLLIALALHIPIVVWFAHETWLKEAPPHTSRPISVRLMQVPPEPPAEEPAPEEPEEEPSGQIVEIAPPENPERPKEAEYLAEYDSTVPEETVDPRYRVDREVIADTWSPDDAFQEADPSPDSVPDPGLGATSGRKVWFRSGEFSLFPDKPSDFLTAANDGHTAPLPSVAAASRYAGSPSNDLLKETQADRTALNAREYLYAAFWNRVKRLVSFYADQTLANARPSVPMTRNKYEIELKGLIGLDGRLQAIEIARGCGIPEFDEALREAFVLAAPFPDPPPGAADPDGFIHIRDFHFTIEISAARAEMTGIDPRSSVQFPGLQTVPR